MPVANPQHIFTWVNFLSGHTSWSFAGLGFISLYLSGKVKAFNREGHVAMLCIVFAPLLAIAMVGNKMYAFGGELKPNFHIDRDLYFFDFETHRWSLAACLMGISRVDDYWHHWQDGFAGALIGLFVAAFCYSQFYPNPYHEEGWGPR